MIFTLTIECDNAAFDDDQSELARIVRNTASRVDGLSVHAEFDGYVSDVNGNTVGTFTLR